MIKINMMKEKFKACSKCHVVKEVGEFCKSKGGKYGVCSQCKMCREEYDKKYREESFEKLRETGRRYREKNADKIKNYPSKSREKMNLYSKKSREKNVGVVRIGRSGKICYICGIEKSLSDFGKDKYSPDGHVYECKECRYKNAKIYRSKEDNKEKIRDYDRKRRRENVNVKLHRNVSRAVLQALRVVGTSKGGGKTFEKLGYNVFQLKESLEKQFDEKTNWGNYGSYWHIDHIIPKSLFCYETMDCEEFRKCWALENLRPLEAKENMRKGNRIEMKKETN